MGFKVDAESTIFAKYVENTQSRPLTIKRPDR